MIKNKELKYKTEKHDYEKLFKSPKIDNDYYTKKKILKKKKALLIITDFLIVS